jgi:hypothetical protein
VLDLTGPVREIDVDDIVPPARPPTVGKLRESHHAVARLFAQGLRNAEISLQTGYSLSRLSVLQDDPTFMELVAFYRDDAQKVAQEMEAKFLLVGNDFMQELHDRLLGNPDGLSDALILEAAKQFLDRAGFSPVNRSISKSLVMNIGERLDRANGRRTEENVPLAKRGFGVSDAA